MKIEAIVYSSMTGSTAQYAQMLSEKTGLPAYTLTEAEGKLQSGATVLFMSWLMAGALVDYKKAAARYQVLAACSVGLNATMEQAAATRKNSKIPDAVPLFALQGGYHPQKLKGMYRFMMKLVTKVLIKKISAVENKSEEEESMLYTLKHGGSFVKEENLEPIVHFLQE